MRNYVINIKFFVIIFFKGGFTKMLGLGGFVTPLGTNTKPGISNEACTQFGFWRRLWMAVIMSLLTIQSARKLRQFSIFATNEHARSTKEARLPRGKLASYYFEKITKNSCGRLEALRCPKNLTAGANLRLVDPPSSS